MTRFSIIELLQKRSSDITKIVNLTIQRVSEGGVLYEEGSPDPVLMKMLPMMQYSTPELFMLKFKRNRPYLASVVAEGQDIPRDREVLQLSLEELGRFKLAKGRVFTEEDFNTLYRAQMLRSQGPGGQAAANEIEEHYLKQPSMLVSGVMYRGFDLTLQCAVLGAVNYVDGRTGANVNLSYRNQIPSGHLAPTLTGNATWDNSATANGIQDIVDHLDVIYNGDSGAGETGLKRYPPQLWMGATEWANLRNQQSTREIVYRGRGILTEVGAADPSALANLSPPTTQEVADQISIRLSQSNGSPGNVEIRVTDAVKYQLNADGTVDQSPYFPSGYYAFMWPNMGEVAVLPSATNDFAGGITTSTDVIKKDPRTEEATASGNVVPFIMDPRMVASRNVMNTEIVIV